MPGTTTPEPEPLELDRLAMPPSASTALTWVVEPAGLRDGGRPPPGAASSGPRALHAVLLVEVGGEARRRAGRSPRRPARATAR